MKKCVIAIALFCCISSCIKDEAAGKECDVESAWVEGTEYEQYFYQTAEMKKDVSSTETDIQFSVRSLISLSKEIPLNFKMSKTGSVNDMHVFYELVQSSEVKDQKNYCWGTGNSGAGMMMNGKKPEDFPTYSTPDGKEGKGVCLKTLSAGAMGAFLWHHRRVLQTEIITF